MLRFLFNQARIGLILGARKVFQARFDLRHPGGKSLQERGLLRYAVYLLFDLHEAILYRQGRLFTGVQRIFGCLQAILSRDGLCTVSLLWKQLSVVQCLSLSCKPSGIYSKSVAWVVN